MSQSSTSRLLKIIDPTSELWPVATSLRFHGSRFKTANTRADEPFALRQFTVVNRRCGSKAERLSISISCLLSI
jgi:hypothetical protein